jgi:acetyl esterase/lipase
MPEDRSVLTRPAPGPDEVHGYGKHPDQLVEVFHGDGGPLIVLIHGGFWRPGYDRTHIRPLAAALRAAGRTVVSVEYRRTPGDPDASTSDTRAALAAAAGVAPGPVVVAGHSAGGHLALWAAAAAPAPGLVRTVALAPVADLVAADRASLGDGAVRAFLGRNPEGRPDLDPVRLDTPAARVWIVHGEQDAIVPVAQTHSYVEAHPRTEVELVPRAGHFAMIDPLAPAWPAVRDRLLAPT